MNNVFILLIYMNQFYDHIWNIWLYIFLIYFFIFFQMNFYWILCQGSPAVILWHYKNVNLILAPEFHLFFFYFRNFISFFPCFSKTCRKLQFPEFFSHFYILILADAFTSCNQLIFRPYLHHFPLCLVPSLAFISSSFSFCPLCPLFFIHIPSMLPYSVQFLYSFPFSILLLIFNQVPFIPLPFF